MNPMQKKRLWEGTDKWLTSFGTSKHKKLQFVFMGRWLLVAYYNLGGREIIK